MIPKNGRGPRRGGRRIAQKCVADPSPLWFDVAKDSGRSENCTRERGEIVDRIGELAIVELRRAPVTRAHTGPWPGVLGSPFAKRLPAINQIRKQDRFVGVLRHASERNKSRGCAFVTGSAYRIKVLEKHLDGALFERIHRGVRLNGRGKAYLKDVQRILTEIQVVTERRRGDSGTQRLKLVSVEAVAEKWLMPKLADFQVSHPGVVIELETNHRGVDPARRDFDVWIAYVGETAAPRPEGLFEETLYEEDLLPVCSPTLIEALGRPGDPVDLHDWPLLYDIGWDTDWPDWFARQGQPSPDLSRASGFRLYSMAPPPSRAWGRLSATRG